MVGCVEFSPTLFSSRFSIFLPTPFTTDGAVSNFDSAVSNLLGLGLAVLSSRLALTA